MPTKPYDQRIASQLTLQTGQVAATITLLDDGNTLPFIARYRKELTGNLDEEQLRQLNDLLHHLRTVDERRETVINAIREQEQLTPALHKQLEAAETLTELEDLYQPYKAKRRTRAGAARERGLQPLADLILEQTLTRDTLEEVAEPFISDDVPTVEEAYAGARDIVAEAISDHADIRGHARAKALQWGVIQSQRVQDADDPKGIFETYYDFSMRVDRVQPYQILALNRGEREKVLRVRIDIAERDWRNIVLSVFHPNRRSVLAKQLELAIEDAAKRLLLPALERDVRRHLTEAAEAQAIQVFATNLRGLLNQPPLTGQVILGIDPGYRTGCKVAVIDATGKVLETATIYPHPPQKQWQKALDGLLDLIERYGVTLIAIGNGTASRETEQLAAELTRERDAVHYLIVSEAGASVYSASSLARAELPELDVTLRGAVSIARRVQDPLAELVKIDPQSIGVGMYQHDVNQQQLSVKLSEVVESVVNNVGVDVNTASVALLTHVAGIGQKLAERIIAHRDGNGTFANRQALLKVKGLGAKAFEQSAGFLRIREGDNPLDASAIHPESYAVAQSLLDRSSLEVDTPPQRREAALKALLEQSPAEQLAAELDVGVLTLADILEQLIRPGRDPREDLPKPALRSDVLSMEDLHPGMRLTGTARNIVDFGAFIDIGVKNDGLLHRSQIPRHVRLSVGDVIEVEILSVEPERGRIGLTWISAN